MRSFTPEGAPGRCPRCLLLVGFCVCESIGEAQPSSPAIVIVRHHWEAFKSTGTARLAGLALSNARILDFIPENPEPLRAELARLDDAWLLYPGGVTPERVTQPPKTLLLLDGTWRQTRKMLRRLPEVARLPRLSLSADGPGEERDRLRESPQAGARSTLESIADALGALESVESGGRLLALHRTFVERTRRSRGQLQES
jgi:DTW domain-containing protein